jgi:hypothetical protein
MIIGHNGSRFLALEIRGSHSGCAMVCYAGYKFRIIEKTEIFP